MRIFQFKAGRVPLLMSIGSLCFLAACFGTTEKQRKQAEIQYDLGVNELKLGKIPESMNFFSEALKLFPDFPQAENGLGLSFYLLGKNHKALEHFKRALELNPKYSEVRNNLARVYLSLGRYREAIPILKKALEDVFLPESYLAESNLGWALFNVGQEQEGIKLVMNSLAKNENYCIGYEYLALMYKKQKKYDDSLREFSNVVKKCPQYPQGHLNKGKLHLMLGQVDWGCAELSQCRDLGRMTVVGQQCDQLIRSSCPAGTQSSNP